MEKEKRKLREGGGIERIKACGTTLRKIKKKKKSKLLSFSIRSTPNNPSCGNRGQLAKVQRLISALLPKARI
jgi:hypothetical protein